MRYKSANIEIETTNEASYIMMTVHGDWNFDRVNDLLNAFRNFANIYVMTSCVTATVEIDVHSQKERHKWLFILLLLGFPVLIVTVIITQNKYLVIYSNNIYCIIRYV